MNYFTSDLHFGHANIIKLCNRPFSSVETMNEALIENWNRKVNKNDTVYIVGDFAWRSGGAEEFVERLKGNKVLIVGNHDVKNVKKEGFSKYFELITPYLEISLDTHLVTLCHYPMVEWRNSRKEGSLKLGYLIYGHIHNNVKPEYYPLFSLPNALNAGVDVNGFSPVNFSELSENNKNAYSRWRDTAN